MSCMEFMTLINDYIYDRISDENTLEDFIKHQYNCDACREELELYYTLQKGLEDEEVLLDFNAELDKKLSIQEEYLSMNHRVRNITVIASALGEAVLLLTLFIICFLGRQ